jgi:hypothetical protein
MLDRSKSFNVFLFQFFLFTIPSIKHLWCDALIQHLTNLGYQSHDLKMPLIFHIHEL